MTDTLGLLLAVLVTAASVRDSVAGTHLIDTVAAGHPSVRKAWVDGGCRQHLLEHAAHPRNQGFYSVTEALEDGAYVRVADVPPPTGPRLRE